jgi:hypothetical protein
MNQGTERVVPLATGAGMTGGGVWAWLFCSAPVGGHRPLVTIGVPLVANLR